MVPRVDHCKKLHTHFKFLEIGLGCGMQYGPGASAALWKTLFTGCDSEIWFAEFDAKCVAEHKKTGKLDGFNILVGDQANATTVSSWVVESKGKFDVIIDDGGHRNEMILTSFKYLWPTVNPGGLYFMEDLQVGYNVVFHRNGFDEFPPVALVLESWIDSLIMPAAEALPDSNPPFARYFRKDIFTRYPIPPDVDWIFCQKEACVLRKRDQ